MSVRVTNQITCLNVSLMQIMQLSGVVQWTKNSFRQQFPQTTKQPPGLKGLAHVGKKFPARMWPWVGVFDVGGVGVRRWVPSVGVVATDTRRGGLDKFPEQRELGGAFGRGKDVGQHAVALFLDLTGNVGTGGRRGVQVGKESVVGGAFGQ